jgi:hypothetical protein
MAFPLGKPAKLWFQLWMVPTSRAGLPLEQLLKLVVRPEEELGPTSQPLSCGSG